MSIYHKQSMSFSQKKHPTGLNKGFLRTNINKAWESKETSNKRIKTKA